MNGSRLAVDAWEQLFRAHTALLRRFEADDIWQEVSVVEYDVLYTLSRAPQGLSMVELNRDILMSQSGVSKLVARLVDRGLVSRGPDAADRRTACVALTERGREMQRRVGRRHAATVATVMSGALDADQLSCLRALTVQLASAARAPRPDDTLEDR